MSEILAQFHEIMREVFDDDELAISRETTANDVDGWDSLMHINLIIAVEKRFGVRFATAEISGLKGEGQNVGTFLDLVQDKLRAG
jgi:acyl carrier protein